uniref:Farnesyl pyrophosphate synthase n=1 Tax=Mylabris cichorii TaxID=580878 RepID=A0A0U2D675_MYLCI|nr:farnesyl diphosphate synthase [Mylabris cichorii]
MLTTIKSCATRTNREFLYKTIQRQISKTTTATNSDAITRQQKPELHETTTNNNKWIRTNRHNNNRALSTIQTKVKSKSPNIASKDESREFMAVFPDIVRDLTDAGRQTDIPEVNKRFAKLLHYTVPNGKKNRGLSVVTSYKMLEKPENLTPDNIRKAIILGWCVEMLQSGFLITDDFMDNAETRRGLPCWYKLDDVGKQVPNDLLLLLNGIFAILKKHFSNHHCYLPTMELFHDVTLKTVMGQSLDSLSLKDGRPNFEFFTMNKYNAIVKYKTAYYTFTLPMALAMYLADLYDPEMHRQAKTILMEMGLFFQIQDDFLDCFGDPEKTGKDCNDIREGKCTWLSVVALQRANPQQRKIMEEYYGRPDEEAVRIIRNLYEELSLPNTYAVYEEESFNIIRTHIQQISKGLPHKLFFKMVDRIYKREG